VPSCSGGRLVKTPHTAKSACRMSDASLSAVGQRKLRVRRSTRLLHFFSLGLLAVGGVCLLPLVGDLVLTITGVAALVAGTSGVLGLSFTWHRALVLYTLLTWAISTAALVRLVQLGIAHEVNPVRWLLWLCTGLTSVPPALLSSTMHLLRVWRPKPLIGEQNAPLVDGTPIDGTPAALASAHLDAAPLQAALGRPAWPPPNASLALGSDLLATGRVAAAVHSGDVSGVTRNDLASSARVAAAVWPPPPAE